MIRDLIIFNCGKDMTHKVYWARSKRKILFTDNDAAAYRIERLSNRMFMPDGTRFRCRVINTGRRRRIPQPPPKRATTPSLLADEPYHHPNTPPARSMPLINDEIDATLDALDDSYWLNDKINLLNLE